MPNLQVPCRFYMRGNCRFGSRCWNSHDMFTIRTYDVMSLDSEDEMPFSRYLDGLQTGSPSGSSLRSQPEQPQQAQQIETKPKPLWNLTNSISGESVEGNTQDDMLVETVKKLNEAENLVKALRQQLREKSSGENFSWIEHQMEQCMENNLQCSICYELFIKPTVLNCSHTFCHDCIETWTRRVNHCPTCRVYVKSKIHCLTLDIFLDKISEWLPEDIKARRDTLIVERNNTRVETPRRSRRNNNNVRRRSNRNLRDYSIRQSFGALWGDRNLDGADWNVELAQALFDPTLLDDVFSRSRNEDNYSDTS